MEKIKCCPFCGCRSVEVCRTNENACWLSCYDCGAEAESHPNREVAISYWNRRTIYDADATIVHDDELKWEPHKHAGT